MLRLLHEFCMQKYPKRDAGESRNRVSFFCKCVVDEKTIKPNDGMAICVTRKTMTADAMTIIF